MANPPKRKGTGYETEVARAFEAAGFEVHRTEPGLNFDIRVLGRGPQRVRSMPMLATRPDRGETLVSLRLPDLLTLLGPAGYGAHVECKRRGGSLWHHSIFAQKFGRLARARADTAPSPRPTTEAEFIQEALS